MALPWPNFSRAFPHPVGTPRALRPPLWALTLTLSGVLSVCIAATLVQQKGIWFNLRRRWLEYLRGRQGPLPLQWEKEDKGVKAVKSPTATTKRKKKESKSVKASTDSAVEIIPESPAPLRTDQNIYIYFGSQTGTAESYSNVIAQMLRNRMTILWGELGAALPCPLIRVVDLEDFKSKEFSQSQRFAIFCLATYGEGEPTDNAAEFFTWIASRKREAGLLRGLKFGVMGLGNSQYTQFCEMGRAVEKHLLRLGADAICRRGSADDDGDSEKDFAGWMERELEIYWKVYVDLIATEVKKVQRDDEHVAEMMKPTAELPKDNTAAPLMKESETAAVAPPATDLVPYSSNIAFSPSIADLNDMSEESQLLRTPRRAPFVAIFSNSNDELLRLCIDLERNGGDEINGGLETEARFYYHCMRGRVLEIKELRQAPDSAKGLLTKHIDIDLTHLQSYSSALANTADTSTASSATDVKCCDCGTLAHWNKESTGSLPLYVAGDTLDLLPGNLDCSIDWYFERLTGAISGFNVTLDTYVHFIPREALRNLDTAGSSPDRIAFRKYVERELNFSETDSSSKARRSFPTPCTIRQALKYFCDFSGTPSVEILKDLSVFLTESIEQETFKKILKVGGGGLRGIGRVGTPQLYRQLIRNQRLSLKACLELLMTSAKFNLGVALQLFPRLASRPYTISSSSLEDSSRVSITISKVWEELPSYKDVQTAFSNAGIVVPLTETLRQSPSRLFEGCCSSYLCQDSIPDCHVLLSFRKSAMNPPSTGNVPVVMVATGTGIAPFRGFLREWRARAVLAVREGGDPGSKSPAVLFFGCRESSADLLYKAEIESSLQTQLILLDGQEFLIPPVLTSFIGAFSREASDGKKVYVQDRMLEHSNLLWELLNEKAGILYVCGSRAMGKAVIQTVAEIGKSKGHPEFKDKLRRERRLLEEVWG